MYSSDDLAVLVQDAEGLSFIIISKSRGPIQTGAKLFIHEVLCTLIIRQTRMGFNLPDHVSANKEGEDKKYLLA